MELTDLLLTSESSSEFLRLAEARLRNSPLGFSYADFARRAGFSARSYTRAIFVGARPLTLKSMPGFARALGLKREEREMFRCLLALEHPDFDPSLPPEKARRVLKKRRELLERRGRRTQMALEAPTDLEHWPRVYACLGPGANLDFVVKKSGLTKEIASRTLGAMVKSGWIEMKDEIYSLRDHHLVMDNALHANVINSHFQETLKRALQASEHSFKDPERMFFVSSFGVRRSRLPELKGRLIETLLRFIDESEESSEIEEVISLGATLLPGRAN